MSKPSNIHPSQAASPDRRWCEVKSLNLTGLGGERSMAMPPLNPPAAQTDKRYRKKTCRPLDMSGKLSPL
jgi:hypothetical protein